VGFLFSSYSFSSGSSGGSSPSDSVGKLPSIYAEIIPKTTPIDITG